MATQLLDGRLALVTGAGQGNGRAIASGLAEAGARVVVTDINAETAVETAAAIVATDGQAWSFGLDVTDADACAELAATVRGEIGDIAILVNNAGILIRGHLSDADHREAWRRTLNVNVDGTYNVTMAMLDALKASKGTIVNIASIRSFVAPPGSAEYSVSKGAIAQFTRSLASELAPLGIRVNAIAPGIIATPMTATTRADPEALAKYLEHVPMNRVGDPAELAGPTVFLASDLASYVTGAILPVDGGFLTL